MSIARPVSAPAAVVAIRATRTSAVIFLVGIGGADRSTDETGTNRATVGSPDDVGPSTKTLRATRMSECSTAGPEPGDTPWRSPGAGTPRPDGRPDNAKSAGGAGKPTRTRRRSSRPGWRTAGKRGKLRRGRTRKGRKEQKNGTEESGNPETHAQAFRFHIEVRIERPCSTTLVEGVDARSPALLAVQDEIRGGTAAAAKLPSGFMAQTRNHRFQQL